MSKITTNAAERKNLPLASGVLDYFPDALLEVARVSKIGNEQHNPGQPLHWARGKSTDHADALSRHLLDRGKKDSDGGLHSAKVAWRALAMLQEECEAKRKAALAGHVHGPVGDSRGPQDIARDATFWRPERTPAVAEPYATACGMTEPPLEDFWPTEADYAEAKARKAANEKTRPHIELTGFNLDNAQHKRAWLEVVDLILRYQHVFAPDEAAARLREATEPNAPQTGSWFEDACVATRDRVAAESQNEFRGD